MSSTPKTCKISKGTTLEELANFFNLTNEQLKRYHNTYCPLDDLIGYDIPEHVTIVYVPPEDKELREKIFNPNGGKFIKYKNKNTLDNQKSYHKRYGVIQKMFHNNEPKISIHYETELKKQNSKIELIRKSAYINEQKPDLIIEQIADKVGNIFYPLELQMYDNGTIKEITSIKEIQSKWSKLKPDLEDYYKGEEAGKLFQRIDRQLKYEGRILRKMNDSIFNLLFFVPLYETFNDDKTYTFKLEVPFSSEKHKMIFEIILSINEEISKTHKFIVKAVGKYIYKNFRNETKTFSPHENQTEGYFDFTYKLNSKDNSIFSVFGEMGVKSPKLDNKITFECYEQS